MPRQKKEDRSCEGLCKEVYSMMESIITRIDKIEQRLDAIEERLSKNGKKENAPSIQKVEDFNSEEVPEQEDRLKMDYSTKIQSMKNAIAILPPNFVVDGRHTKQNVEAICGFKITDEMMDEAYANFSHEA